jgi:hypothetical protein
MVAIAPAFGFVLQFYLLPPPATAARHAISFRSSDRPTISAVRLVLSAFPGVSPRMSKIIDRPCPRSSDALGVVTANLMSYKSKSMAKEDNNFAS